MDIWKGICRIDDCNKRAKNKDIYCSMHRARIVRHGDPRCNKNNIPLETRLLDNIMPVPESGCWLWTSHYNEPEGYGRLNIKGKDKLAHRLSWEIHNGPIPEGLLVLHKCDTRCCVNPYHLFLGTKKDNAHDAAKKGRMKHIIANKEIPQIFELSKYGFSQTDIGKMYGVDNSTIWSILHCERSAHGEFI